MDDRYEKEVLFGVYCEKCKHWDVEDQREPCCECLEHGTNEATHKPVKFEEKSNK
jgi:hypothetical protein